MEDKYSKASSDLMSEDVRQLLAALLKAQSQFSALKKSGLMIMKHGRINYSLLEDIYNAVEYALHQQQVKIIHYNQPAADFTKEICTTRLMHQPSGQWIADVRLCESEKPGNQGKGSANTYMKRYALMNLLALAPDEGLDDDGAEEQRYAETHRSPRISPSQYGVLMQHINTFPAEIRPELVRKIKAMNNVDNLEALTESQLEHAITLLTTGK